MKNTIQEINDDYILLFLNQSGWGDAIMTPMGADMGLRRYFKLERDGKTALLMDMSRAGILEIGLEAYVHMDEHLKTHGVRVPEIYHYDLKSGLAVIEDMGCQSFGNAVSAGQDREKIYGLATDILVKIRQSADSNILGLRDYKETLIWKRLGQFVDYYMPIATGRATTQHDHQEFRAMWDKIEASLPPCPMGICHADFHLENIMWCPDLPEGYGLIDFQDGFWGAQPYDLLNLLEDARQTVPADIKQAMKARYCEGMTATEMRAFEAWYALMAAQFHCRVIGLFVKFTQENERKEFITHVPRLQGYLREHLKNPVLAPLKEFIEGHNISLDIPVTL